MSADWKAEATRMVEEEQVSHDEIVKHLDTINRMGRVIGGLNDLVHEVDPGRMEDGAPPLDILRDALTSREK